MYRISFREASQDPGEAGGDPPAQDHRSVPAALPQAPAGNETRRIRRFLKTSEAGAFVGLSGKTLARMRVTGGGPVYSKRGSRVIYDIADLEIWMKEGKRRFTAEVVDQS